jgi:general secretion pathway protein D
MSRRDGRDGEVRNIGALAEIFSYRFLLKSRIFFLFFLFAFPVTCALSAQTISEKKALISSKKENEELSSEEFLQKINRVLPALRLQLDTYYKQALSLKENEASEEEFKNLLREVNALKTEIGQVESQWREAAVNDAKREEEGYALWDQEETTLAQLVMEYGAMDFLYIVPPEMAMLKLNMHSGIPIPRESWSEVLEIILAHNGIGVKKLNSYARQLFVFKQDPSAVQQIASRPSDLRFIPSGSRIFYLFSPPVEQVRTVFQFFERFSDTKQTFIHQIANKIAIVSSKEEVEKLLALYNTVWKEHSGKISKVVPITKMGVKEMEKILISFFGEAIDKARQAPFAKMDQDGLTVQPLGQGNALILIGSQEVVYRAEKIVRDTEEQLQDPAEMTIYVYSCKHSDPTDLARVLDKVYTSLFFTGLEPAKDIDLNFTGQGLGNKPPDGFPPMAPLVVAPPPLKPGTTAQLEIEQRPSDHFIADPKTGSLLMVVRRDVLSKIKDLLKKLDVPKKMVQIEVLLFEKTLDNHTAFGLNLLKLGGNNQINFKAESLPQGKGVLHFILHKHKTHFPAYDFAYNFLMTQEYVQLNAAPSIITVNQTPATINIVDEISINNGAAPVDTNKGTTFEKSFSRQQYGITIVLTPTVHLPDDEETSPDTKGFVTLQTNITFDTPHSHHDDRPRINRRHIENEVRVVDGQTVIIGGLRKKTVHDAEEKLPFLGELPGIGKLFGTTNLIDKNTEMFFFITPTIVKDPKDQLDYFRSEELKKRAGDIPEFLERLLEARDKEDRRFFENSMKLFFGKTNAW